MRKVFLEKWDTRERKETRALALISSRLRKIAWLMVTLILKRIQEKYLFFIISGKRAWIIGHGCQREKFLVRRVFLACKGRRVCKEIWAFRAIRAYSDCRVSKARRVLLAFREIMVFKEHRACKEIRETTVRALT